MAQPTPVLSHLPDAHRTELIMSVPNSLPQVTTASVSRKPPGRPVSAAVAYGSPARTVTEAYLSIRAGSARGSGGLSCRLASQLADPALRNAQQHRRIATNHVKCLALNIAVEQCSDGVYGGTPSVTAGQMLREASPRRASEYHRMSKIRCS
jgi:hypothetical protein